MSERLIPQNCIEDTQLMFGGDEFAQKPDDVTSKEDLFKEWKEASAEIIRYKSGIVRPENSPSYRYPSGRRLIIKDELVMDTCEGPWGQAIVDNAFNHPSIQRLNPDYSLKVLERGAGLNIAGTRIVRKLMGRGSGEYHVIELNDDVANMAEEWKKRMEAQIRYDDEAHGSKYKIKIVIHRGEAREVSKKLADEGNKFNIIISDTYPLESDEKGVNDIEDMDVIKKLLYRENGVFGFFSYFPGMRLEGSSHLAAKQLELVQPHFEQIGVSEAHVKPPKEYVYLFNDGNPTRSLPVVICSGKK